MVALISEFQKHSAGPGVTTTTENSVRALLPLLPVSSSRRHDQVRLDLWTPLDRASEQLESRLMSVG